MYIERLTQGELDSLLEGCGSRGFFTADGTRSRALARLPEEGPVRLSYWVSGRLLAWGRGMARLPSALLPRIARRSLMGGFGAIKRGRSCPAVHRLRLRCLQGDEAFITPGPTQQELEPLRAFVRSVAGAENDGFVVPLQTTPFEHPDGDKRCWGGACLLLEAAALMGRLND